MLIIFMVNMKQEEQDFYICQLFRLMNLGLNTSIQKESYPELSKGFLYSVPTIFVLWPAILLGIHEATKNNHSKTEENE